MRNFDVNTVFENNCCYMFEGDIMNCGIKDTVRLDEKIYRASYPSEKNYMDTAIYLKDLSDVTLDFNGATLFLTDDTIQPFVLDGCKNITIKNVVVEYERSMMDEMDLIDIKDGELWFKQTEKQKKHFPLKVDNGNLIPISGDKEYTDALKEPHFFNLHDRENGESRSISLVRIGADLPVIPWESYPFKYNDLYAEQRGEYIVLHGELPTNVMKNVTCTQCHSARDINSCFIICSNNVKLENFRVLNGGGMGILGMYSENITMDRVKFFKDEHSHGISTNAADAVHLISCFGKVEISDSVFESMKDDAINIHGNYYTVENVKDGIIYTKLNTDVQANPAVNAYFKMFGDGDRISICRGSTTVQKKTLLIKRVDITDDFHTRLYVDGDLSGIEVGDTIENLSIQTDLHIKNCRFGKALTHLRIQTRGKILIEDCECHLQILLSGDKNYWYEGSPVEDITIRNCRFVSDHANIMACPEFESCDESPYYHAGIKVIGNTFDTQTALYLNYCEDILFEGNVNTKGLEFTNVYKNCTDLKIKL